MKYFRFWVVLREVVSRKREFVPKSNPILNVFTSLEYWLNASISAEWLLSCDRTCEHGSINTRLWLGDYSVCWLEALLLGPLTIFVLEPLREPLRDPLFLLEPLGRNSGGTTVHAPSSPDCWYCSPLEPLCLLRLADCVACSNIWWGCVS